MRTRRGCPGGGRRWPRFEPGRRPLRRRRPPLDRGCGGVLGPPIVRVLAARTASGGGEGVDQLLPCGLDIGHDDPGGELLETFDRPAGRYHLCGQVEVAGVVVDEQFASNRPGCLWSAEVIEALRAEGHPVEVGSCGENVLVSGLRWADVRPGVRLHLGPDVVAEIAGPAEPCSTIAASFRDRRSNRVSHDRYPGSSRLYAWVEAGGVMRPGDAITMS